MKLTDEAVEAVAKTPTAAPSSPHLVTDVLREFGHEEDGGGWVLFADHLEDFHAALLAAGVFAEGATPAIDRDALILTLHKEGAYCGDCNYEDWDTCEDCRKVLGHYADAVLKLIGGTS